MVLWIGVDDTDSLEGMCTTFLATELVSELTKDRDLIGYPRLVRLNPNIPWKTRGNGAICLRFGRGVGPGTVVGEIENQPVLSFAQARGRDDPATVHGQVARLVERRSAFGDPTTNPGSGVLREYKNGRGIIGALAATAWRPRDRTYEVLSYRDANRWGTPRVVEPDSVREMDRVFPSTFNNYDYDCNHVVIAPHSPCPVLFGIRGDDPTVLPAAMRTIRGERPASWLVFETNQGTDDHVSPRPSFRPHTAGVFAGKVDSAPRSLRGGHVVFGLEGMDVTAYEPSKQFRGVVRQLALGDHVEVIASVRAFPRTLNLEKLRVVSLARVVRKASNPVCESCDKRMKSLGRAGGFRCIRCGL